MYGINMTVLMLIFMFLLQKLVAIQAALRLADRLHITMDTYNPEGKDMAYPFYCLIACQLLSFFSTI